MAVLGAVTWLGLALRLYLVIGDSLRNGTPMISDVVRFFSYFTILTNITVALCLTIVLVAPLSRLGRFFSAPGTETAIATYITFVCIVYNLLLRHLWNPQGLDMIADEIMHDIVPVMFVIYWAVFVSKNQIVFRDIPRWLIYPLVYAAYALLRGSIVHEYPYPFVDVGALGYPRVFVHIAGLMAAFVALGAVFVGVARVCCRRAPST
jgi:hypothetical protein